MATRPTFLDARPRVRTEDKAERDRFYGSKRWSRMRLYVLSIKPLCEACKRSDARIVHHVIDRLERPDLAWDLENMQALCSPCHTRLHKVKP